MAAKASLNTLSADERTILVNKLLKASAYEIQGQGLGDDRVAIVQKLFNDIGELSGQLHQGHLLIQKYVDLVALEEGVERNIMDQIQAVYGAMNLFHGACQEAWIERQVAAA